MKRMAAAALMAMCSAMAGCTTSGLDAIGLGSDNIPENANPRAARTGVTPTFSAEPAGATEQLSNKETAEIQNDLRKSAVPQNQVVAAARDEANYRRQVAGLQREAAKARASNRRAEQTRAADLREAAELRKEAERIEKERLAREKLRIN